MKIVLNKFAPYIDCPSGAVLVLARASPRRRSAMLRCPTATLDVPYLVVDGSFALMVSTSVRSRVFEFLAILTNPLKMLCSIGR